MQSPEGVATTNIALSVVCVCMFATIIFVIMDYTDSIAVLVSKL